MVLVCALALLWVPGWAPPPGGVEAPVALETDRTDVDDLALSEELAFQATDFGSGFMVTDDDIFSGAEIVVSGSLGGSYRLESTSGG